MVSRPFDKGVDLDIKVPNDITLKFGNGGVIKNQELRNQERQLREQKRELERNKQKVQKMQHDYQYKYRFTTPAMPAMPAMPFANRFGQSNGILQGDISIRDFSGTMEINAVNGSINAKNIQGEVTASTVDGNIHVTFRTLNRDKALYLSTVDGDIDITLPKDTNADIIARTMEGDVYSGFEGDTTLGKETSGKEDETMPQNFYNTYINSNYITTRINKGGHKVYLNTIDGNIYIRKGE